MSRQAAFDPNEWRHQGEHEQRRGQKLQPQQQPVLQLLPWTVGLDIAQNPIPQHMAGNQRIHILPLKQIHQYDQRDR
ncbi:hypothetical protein D3C77_508690 [compost metagenome]